MNNTRQPQIASRPIRNTMIKKLFEHLDYELSPTESSSELYDKIKNLSIAYVEKKNSEYRMNCLDGRFCFGKHKGKLIEYVLFNSDKDKQYCEWLMLQDWFREKFPDNYSLMKSLLK